MVAVCVLMSSSCGAESSARKGAAADIALVVAERSDGYDAAALFTARLSLVENCLVLEGRRGAEHLAAWPTGTTWDGTSGDVTVGSQTFSLDARQRFGGGAAVIEPGLAARLGSRALETLMDCGQRTDVSSVWLVSASD